MCRVDPDPRAVAPRRSTLIAIGRRGHRAVRGDDRASRRTTSSGARVLDDQPARLHVPRRRARARTCAAIFHMVTHAFFKALLFLGAGSVIHGMHDEQDMRRMGGLRKFMPITVGDVHRRAGSRSPACRRSPASGRRTRSCCTRGTRARRCGRIGLVTALLTAFYMSRQVFMVFLRRARERRAEEHEATHVEPRRTSRRGR